MHLHYATLRVCCGVALLSLLCVRVFVCVCVEGGGGAHARARVRFVLASMQACKAVAAVH